jgi:hypothetical protein
MAYHSVVIVRQFIETDGHLVIASQLDDGQCLKIVIGDNLQTLDVGQFDTMPSHQGYRRHRKQNQ